MATSTTSLKACIPMVKSIFRRRTMGFCPCMLLVTRMFCVSCPELLGGRMLDATGGMLSWMNLGTAACMEKPEAPEGEEHVQDAEMSVTVGCPGGFEKEKFTCTPFLL